MQPTYIPWMGYFAMMHRADVFVLLDSVQFARRSWQQRNQIKTADGAAMLTIPVFSKGKRDQFISEVEVDWAAGFAPKHQRTIQQAYAKAPHFAAYRDGLFALIEQQALSLADYTIALLEWLRDSLSIRCEFARSSELQMDPELRKAGLLAEICKNVGGTTYLSAPGSRDYLDESDAFQAAGIPIQYHHYDHPVHPQLHGEFVPYMSVIDVLFNTGPASLEWITRGINEQKSGDHSGA